MVVDEAPELVPSEARAQARRQKRWETRQAKKAAARPEDPSQLVPPAARVEVKVEEPQGMDVDEGLVPAMARTPTQVDEPMIQEVTPPEPEAARVVINP